jgi:glutamine synthetase
MCALMAPASELVQAFGAGYERRSISVGRVSTARADPVPRPAVPEATRLELRCPDPSCNPYLAFAVMLKCGLDGIKNELPVPDATEEDLFESKWRREGLVTLPRLVGRGAERTGKRRRSARGARPHIYDDLWTPRRRNGMITACREQVGAGSVSVHILAPRCEGFRGKERRS